MTRIQGLDLRGEMRGIRVMTVKITMDPGSPDPQGRNVLVSGGSRDGMCWLRWIRVQIDRDPTDPRGEM